MHGEKDGIFIREGTVRTGGVLEGEREREKRERDGERERERVKEREQKRRYVRGSDRIVMIVCLNNYYFLI